MSFQLYNKQPILPSTAAQQPCVRAIHQSRMPEELKYQMDLFIQRNLLPDCGRVSPNCLKAHLIRTAKKLGLDKQLTKLNSMFRAPIGFKGYYLDAGKLYRVKGIDNLS